MMNAAFNDSAQFCPDDFSNVFRREDYILGGQSVIPQPMCESQLQSEITQTDDLRTDKFITLASKSAAMGYEFSQNEGDQLICASNHSSRRSSDRQDRVDYAQQKQHYSHHHHHQSGLNDSEARLTLKQVRTNAANTKNKRKMAGGAGRKERQPRKEKKAQFF